MKKDWSRFSFVSNFKNLTFLRFSSLNFLSKYESYNLLHYKMNCCKLVFCVFPEQLLPLVLRGYIAMKLLLLKSFINHYYKIVTERFSNKKVQNIETKIFKQKRFQKNLFKVTEKKRLGHFEVKWDNL